MLRASSVRRFGRRVRGRHVRRDTNSNGHEVNFLSWLLLFSFIFFCFCDRSQP
uniref:Uncharacterized protein MANES_12G025000 n=1 Tax=Rhizophora mucronata TaxID=61149 RepID=A0A2P2K2P7_RHIMU